MSVRQLSADVVMESSGHRRRGIVHNRSTTVHLIHCRYSLQVTIFFMTSKQQCVLCSSNVVLVDSKCSSGMTYTSSSVTE